MSRLVRRLGTLAVPIALSGLAIAVPPADATVVAASAAPDFTLKSTAGQNLRLAEQRGQVVLVNFWASWCGPCKIEMPHLNRLHDKYRASGVVLLGVNIDEDIATASRAAAQLGVKFPVLHDAGKQVARRYDLGTMPSTVLIDRDGKVRYVHLGYRDGLEGTYDQQLRALIKE